MIQSLLHYQLFSCRRERGNWITSVVQVSLEQLLASTPLSTRSFYNQNAIFWKWVMFVTKAWTHYAWLMCFVFQHIFNMHVYPKNTYVRDISCFNKKITLTHSFFLFVPNTISWALKPTWLTNILLVTIIGSRRGRSH